MHSLHIHALKSRPIRKQWC